MFFLPENFSKRQLPFPLVHELGTLVALLPDDQMPPGGFDLAKLNPYATVLRYEEPNSDLTSEEIEQALTVSEQVIAWARAIVK